MNWEVITEDDKQIILQVKTLDNKTKRVHLISSPGSNTVGVFYIDDIPIGIFDPEIKEKSIKLGVWNALLDHEVMHLYPEFVAQWYSVMDVFPEIIDINIKRLIPNVFEGIAINHTLFLWEASPIRGGPYFKKSEITEKVVRYYKEICQSNNIPPSVAAVRELLSNVHIDLLENIIAQKKHGEKRTDIHVRLKNKIYGEVTPFILNNLNKLLNSFAVSLSVNGRTVVCEMNIKREQTPIPLFETRCNGRIIPQYVHLCSRLINPIYDSLDVHFAEAYDIKVEKLRKAAYHNYKKTIRNYKNKKIKRRDNKKSIVLFPSSYKENKKLIFDFSLKMSDRKIGGVPRKITINNEIGKMEITSGEVIEPWERLERIRMAELLRLKKWME